MDLDFAGAILPTSDQSVAHEPMPLQSELLPVHDRGDRKTWPDPRRGQGDLEDLPVSSRESRGLRSALVPPSTHMRIH